MTPLSRQQAAAADLTAEQGALEDLWSSSGDSIAAFASLVGPEHVVEAANPAFFAAVGEPSARTGTPMAELVPELTGRELLAVLDEVYRSGESRQGREVRVVLGSGVLEREAFFDFTCEPRRDADGGVTGVRVLGIETTQVKQAQRLMSEHGSLLEQIARQAPLHDVLEGMARCIEDLAPRDVLVSVLLADADGTHLRHGAGPSLPAFYNEAIDGISTGEGVGSCGTAAHRREPVVVTDIRTDPFWIDFRDLAARAGLAACWSTPILARDGALLGTFAMYHASPRAPQDGDVALARMFAGTAALAIERHHIEQAKKVAEARATAAHDALVEAVRAEQKLRAEAEQRAEAEAELNARMRAAAAAQAKAPRPDHCQLGGRAGCDAPVELRVTDGWGDSAWGCFAHAEEAIFHAPSVFLADEENSGLAAYLNR